MKKYRFLFPLFLGFAVLLHVLPVSAQSPLPENYRIEEGFQPGLGDAVGEVLLTQGQVLVIHKNRPDTAYIVLKGTPLFKDDRLITSENGKASLKFPDDSVLTLTTGTSMVINESIYREDAERSSFISMTLGKARFFVTKFLDFRRSDFTVKTKTAIVGVRGSDFIVEVLENATKVTAMEDTRLEIVSLITPCKNPQQMKKNGECEVEPTVLTDFRQVLVQADGQIQISPDLLSPDEIDIMKQEFIIRPDGREYTRTMDETDFRKGILLSNDSLIAPELLADMAPSAGEKPDITGRIFEDTDFPSDTGNLPEEIHEDMSEDIIDSGIQEPGELPGFPGNPE